MDTRFRSAAPLLVTALALVAAHATAAGDDDAVNERPPVTRAQLERHWGVDCARLRAALLAGGGAPAPREREHLALCAAIYNAPGDESALRCPDYARAARALARPAAATPATATTTRTEILEALSCTP